MLRFSSALLAGCALLGAACGSTEPPVAYSAQLRADFLTACTDTLADPEVVTEVCKCVFAQAQSELSISVFASYEATLKNDPFASLPQPIVEILARCVLEETGLQD